MGKPNMEAVAAKPEEDGWCSLPPLGLGGRFVEKALMMSSLLLLMSGFLGKKALIGGFLIKI